MKLKILALLIFASLKSSLFAIEQESKEWNELKATTKDFLDRSQRFANHALSDAKDTLNSNGEVKNLKKDFNQYYDKISSDTKSVLNKIENSKEAATIRQKANEIWTSIFGNKPH